MSKARIFQGVVTADKSDKTITVLVKDRVAHQVYGSPRSRRKKYKAHDETNQAKIGDQVRIVESRPYSKDKHFRLLEIIK
ncbi:MAG: 30S ribosomal protein S17 [Candidatus Omnitrophota bacterium]